MSRYRAEIRDDNSSFSSMDSLIDNVVAMHYNGTNINDPNIKYTLKRLSSTRGLFENLNYSLIETIGHSFYNMFVSCEYLGEQCNFTYFTLQPTADFLNCYTFRPQNSSVGTGMENGLFLTVFLESDRLSSKPYPFLTKRYSVDHFHGLRMEIHEHETLPNVKLSGINIMPGSSIDVKIKQNRHVTHRFLVVGNRKEQIFEKIESYRYSIDRCMDIHKEHFIFKTCGCVSSDIPLSNFLIKNNASFCGNISTLQDQDIRVLGQKIRCELDAKKSFSPKKRHSCPNLNEFSEYSYSMSHSGWPLQDSIRPLFVSINESSSASAQSYFSPLSSNLNNESVDLFEDARSNLVKE